MRDKFKKNIAKQVRYNEFGFTLMELVVAATIFTVVMTTVMTMFINNTKSNNKTLIKQLIGSETRYALSLMAMEIRSGIIDYDYYGGTINGVQDDLALIDPEGNTVIFKQVNDTLGISRSDSGLECVPGNLCLDEAVLCAQDDDPCFRSAVSSGIKVTNLRFFITTPESIILNPTVIEQTKVTLIWSAESDSEDPEDVQKLDLQTTVSSRRYK